MKIRRRIFLGVILVLQLLFSSKVVSASCNDVATCVRSAAESASSAVAVAKTLVPTGAVVAFALEKCPAHWSIYEPARGVFIRGIDTTNSKDRDPDGKRQHGNYQSDSFKKHSHAVQDAGIAKWQQSVTSNKQRVGSWNGGNPITTSSNGGPETRPRNVALLYCIKN